MRVYVLTGENRLDHERRIIGVFSSRKAAMERIQDDLLSYEEWDIDVFVLDDLPL